jgi:HTH-type transcriptional regulator / antitoxin HigA
METKMNAKHRPARAAIPGDILRDELAERGWSQREFADMIGKPYQAVSEIINGKKGITADTALRFADALGTSPKLWLNLETSYRLALARQKRRESARISAG